jgi:Superinfection immunity protein
MKKLTMFIVLLAGAMSAYATIGDTPEQFRSHFNRVERGRKYSVLIGYGNYTIVAADFLDGYVEKEVILKNDHYKFTPEEISYYGRKYKVNTTFNDSSTRWHRGDYDLFIDYLWTTFPDGNVYPALHVYSGKYRLHDLPDTATPTPPPAVAQATPVPMPAAVPSTTPQPVFNTMEWYQPLMQTDGNNGDCMIVATEYYNRLSDQPFRNILSISFKSGKVGHAYAAWTMMPGGRIWIGDGLGSIQLNTTSTKLEDLAPEVQRAIALRGLYGSECEVRVMKWVYANGVPSQGPVVVSKAEQATNVVAAFFGFCVIALVLVMGVLFYFLPTLIAFVKRKSNAPAILVLNIFGGWTFLGWLVSLVWACTKDSLPLPQMTSPPVPRVAA